MFDSSVGLAELDAVRLAAAVTDTQDSLRRAECRVLELACAWADVHSRDTGDDSPLVERVRFFGGDGTPAVEEFCVAELGALHGTSTMAAELLLADALDLRHRLPRLWVQVQAGQVRAWQARKVAELTRLPHLGGVRGAGRVAVREDRPAALGPVPTGPGGGGPGR